MPRSNWREINARISYCRSRATPVEAIACLKSLYEETGDGMVALALGEELEISGDSDSAISYYKKAEELFPLAQFKSKASLAIERLSAKVSAQPGKEPASGLDQRKEPTEAPSIDLADHDPNETLFVVSCTKGKIWDISPSAPEYVPARFAYVGDSFLKFIRWADEHQLERKGFKWMILSGKYGFIEPWHPISYYDIRIDDDSYFPVTDDYLVNQVKQVRWQKNPDSQRTGYSLAQFGRIVCVNCSQSYVNKVADCFQGKDIEEISI